MIPARGEESVAGDSRPDEDEAPILDGAAPAPAEGNEAENKSAYKRARYNKAESERLFDEYLFKRDQNLQQYIEEFNRAKEWALVMDMTWLHNILLFLEDIQALEETSKKKERQTFYEKAHTYIVEMNTNFRGIGDPEERVVFREGPPTRKPKYVRKRFRFWTAPEIKKIMQLGKQLLDLFFQSKWSLFVDQADISITSYLDPSCSILSERLVPHWTMYIGDQFLRTYFVQLLNYHRMVSLGSQIQKVTFLKFYKSELDAYRSRISQLFMMRVIRSTDSKFAIAGGSVQNLSPNLTLWIMYQDNINFRARGAVRSEEIKFEQIVENLFTRDIRLAEQIKIEDNINYVKNAWKLGIPTRFVTSSFHPVELSYVLEYMYGKDRFRMLQWENFIRWSTRGEDSDFESESDEEYENSSDGSGTRRTGPLESDNADFHDYGSPSVTESIQ